MIIKHTWVGCEPNEKWEAQIKQTLESVAIVKPITKASMRVEESLESTPPFHLTLILSMPGPDVLVHGLGQNFYEALMNLVATAFKKLAEQNQKAFQSQTADCSL